MNRDASNSRLPCRDARAKINAVNPAEETPNAVTRFLQIMDTLGPPPEEHRTNADEAEILVSAWNKAARYPDSEMHLTMAIDSNMSAAWSLFNIAILKSRHSQDTLDAAPLIALDNKALMEALPWLMHAVAEHRRKNPA